MKVKYFTLYTSCLRFTPYIASHGLLLKNTSIEKNDHRKIKEKRRKLIFKLRSGYSTRKSR
jgi:hypothetical protein